MTIGATSQQDYLLRTMYHLRLKIFVYTTFFVLRFFLQSCKILLYGEYALNEPVRGWKLYLVDMELAVKAIQVIFTIGVAILFIFQIRQVVEKKREAEGKRIQQFYYSADPLSAQRGPLPRKFKSGLVLTFILILFHLEQNVNELIYDALFNHYAQDRAARDQVALARGIERHIVWALTEFMTASSILYLIYSMGREQINKETSDTVCAKIEMDEILGLGKHQ